jgi:hypothetical protein
VEMPDASSSDALVTAVEEAGYTVAMVETSA